MSKTGSLAGAAAAIALAGLGARLVPASEGDNSDPNHPLRGREPANGTERALIREWEQSKRRAALYGNPETSS